MASSAICSRDRLSMTLEEAAQWPIATPMQDLGPVISPLALREGVPVFDRDGERIGVVDRVVIDSEIFEGLIVHTRPLPGRHLYAGHEQIAEVHERGVVLSVDASELHPLRRPRARADDGTPEHPLERRLRHAWDKLTGAV